MRAPMRTLLALAIFLTAAAQGSLQAGARFFEHPGCRSTWVGDVLVPVACAV